MIFITALLTLVFSLSVFAQQPAQINVALQLAPFKQYYDTRAEWPKAHGWKPYKRYEYDVVQRAYPDDVIPAGAVWEAWQEMSRISRRALDEPWTPLGPFNHGGRTRVLRFHPNNPDIMFAGSVGGGLFRSDNAGDSWYPITDMLPNLAVGSFEISESNPNVMYLGTGEGYFNGDAIKGIGLLKSVDGGLTWNTTALSYDYSAGTSILKISVDPRNSDIVLASTNGGLYRSTDGGATFTLVRTGNVNELKRDPQTPDVLLCAAGNSNGAGTNGVYRSTDNGATWTASNTGLPSILNIGRIVLTIYPDNPLVVYAGISGTFNYNGTQMIGVYRSTDNGQTWERVSQTGEVSHYVSQGWYDMAIAVDPDDASVVFNAGLDIYRTVNGGESWSRRSWWDHAYGDPTFSHADHHELIFHPENGDELWNVNDGGIFVSYNNGNTWNEKNTGYNTFQYYAMGNATLNTALAYGGSQDNGTTEYDGDGDWDHIFGGDGGYCVVDYTDDNTIYVEYQNGNRFRSDNGGASFSDINSGISGGGPWVTPIVQDPFLPNTIYTTTSSGGSRVWMSPNQGRNGNWQSLGTVGGSNQVLAASPALSGRLYLGSSSSVMRYDAGDGAWTAVSGNLPNTYVTRVTPHPYDPNIVYVTKSGFSEGHVWKSTQGGTVWTDITGNLPNVPFQDIVVDLHHPSTLYAGGDLGVFVSESDGATWEVLGEGLPVVRVDDMEMQAQTGVLRVATHGRGMWEIPTGGPDFTLFYPNGGEVLGTGTTITIRWSDFGIGGAISLEINRDYPSGTWQSLGTNLVNDGAHSWLVSGPPSQRARFRITHATQGEFADTSDADLRIASPGLAILSPNGGETVFSGVNDTIRFERTLVQGALVIELNRNYPNSEWETLAENSANQDFFVWRVQQPGGDHCRVRVTSVDEPELTDTSAEDFIIRAPQMSLIAPNGGEIARIDEPFEINWSAAEHAGSFRILLNRNYPSGSWEMVSPGVENDGSFLWTPRGPATANARVRLTTVFDPIGTYLESAADFTIDVSTAASNPFVPSEFNVSEAYPNPFNPVTHFTLDVPAHTHVTAQVLNQLGQRVATLLDAPREAGRYTLTFDGNAFSSGLYFLRIEAEPFRATRKLILLK